MLTLSDMLRMTFHLYFYVLLAEGQLPKGRELYLFWSCCIPSTQIHAQHMPGDQSTCAEWKK